MKVSPFVSGVATGAVAGAVMSLVGGGRDAQSVAAPLGGARPPTGQNTQFTAPSGKSGKGIEKQA